MDPRTEKLARTLVRYSTHVGVGDRVVIEASGARELVRALVREIYAAGGVPFVNLSDATVQRELALGCTEEQLAIERDVALSLLNQVQVSIHIAGGENACEFADVPTERMKLKSLVLDDPIFTAIQKNGIRWCVLRFPTPALAQAAGMSQEGFRDFFYDVCTLDYARMSAAMDPLRELMERTDRVHILGPGTDLRFSIAGLPAIRCAGDCNIPDGEIYTAPVRDSVEGVIRYNTPSVQDGYTFENVELRFERGRIVHATANDAQRINRIFDIDEGARYVGEFSLGLNPCITRPMKDTLFDEKIAGSFHFTPGMSYDDCFNGNRSALHWDLVCIQTPEWGGGEIWFDDVLIRKDGRFVPEALQGLNPENLK